MDDLQKSVAFQEMIRKNLAPILESKGYRCRHNNELEDQANSHNWVFRLIFSGGKVIEISNDDWRDYIEWFNVYADGKEIMSIDIRTYPDLPTAFNEFQKKVLALL